MSTWTRPSAGVYKINVSGSADYSRTRGSIGCVLRNITGYCIGGYYGTIDYESELVTDLRAIYYGFKVAEEKGLLFVEVDCNSQIAAEHVLHPDPSFTHADIVQEIRELMCTIRGSCLLKHVPISSNQLAITLAHYSLDEGVHIRSLIMCPSVLIPVMAADWIASL